jgi:hypothetical protein
MPTLLDPSLYPASYQTSVWRGGLRVLGFMTFAVIGLLAKSQIIERGGPRYFVVCIALALLFLLVMIVNITFAKITLYPDRIERATWFGRKGVLRSDVVRLERRRSWIVFTTLYLASKKGLFAGVLIPNGIETDAAWNAWMSVVQDGGTMRTKDTPSVGQRS